jgi:gluconate 2-dehydrogenase gamma chain
MTVDNGEFDQQDFAMLTRYQADILVALMECIFPADGNGPGAREIGAVHYVDKLLARGDSDLENTYRGGLAALDAWSTAFYEVPCPQLDADLQSQILLALEHDEVPVSLDPQHRKHLTAAFFEMLRVHTLEGLFGDPAHGGNRGLRGWRLLGYLGPQPGYSHAEQQLNAPVVRDHVVVASDYPQVAEEYANE